MSTKQVRRAKAIRTLGAVLATGMAASFVPCALASARATTQSPTAYADLAVFVNDGRGAFAGPGAETTYVITVTNAGPASVLGASIANALPRGLSGASWGCLAQPGVVCSEKGSGDLSDQIDLPAGSSAIYVLTATLDEAVGTTIATSVSVSAPEGVIDPVSPNNSAVDVNGVGVTPSLAALDVTVDLSSAGPTTATVRLDLQAALPYGLTVAFSTADDTAAAGSDYTAAAGSLTFAPGVTSQTVTVEVLPSNEGGTDRRFFVDFTITSLSGLPESRAAVTAAWPSGFNTVNPCRLVDTRSTGALLASTTRRFGVAGQCGIPATARAIAANVTVADATSAGDLRVFAAGLATPETSNVNYAPGRTRAAQAMVALSLAGEIDVYSAHATGNANLVLDVAGYFK